MASSSSEPVAPKKEDKEFTPGDVTERDDETTLEEEEKKDQGDVKVRAHAESCPLPMHPAGF